MSDITDRIAKLLRQAEHKNTSPEEADAFFAKAQALMAQHAIDILTVRQHMADGDKDPLGALGRTTVECSKSYERQDATLAHVIAGVNDCKVLYDKGMGRFHIYGYETDRLNVQLLYASLNIVVSKQALEYGRQSGLAGMKLFVARRSFREAFAQRIGERLKDAHRKVYAGVDNALLPAIASKKYAVERYSPGGKKVRSHQSYDGYAGHAGRRAADKADIGGVRIGTNVRGAIG